MRLPGPVRRADDLSPDGAVTRDDERLRHPSRLIPRFDVAGWIVEDIERQAVLLGEAPHARFLSPIIDGHRHDLEILALTMKRFQARHLDTTRDAEGSP